MVPNMVQHQHISTGSMRSLTNVNKAVANPTLPNCVNAGGLQYIISLWQVPIFPETHLWKEAENTIKKMGKMKIAPRVLPSLPSSSLLPHAHQRSASSTV